MSLTGEQHDHRHAGQRQQCANLRGKRHGMSSKEMGPTDRRTTSNRGRRNFVRLLPPAAVNKPARRCRNLVKSLYRAGFRGCTIHAGKRSGDGATTPFEGCKRPAMPANRPIFLTRIGRDFFLGRSTASLSRHPRPVFAKIREQFLQSKRTFLTAKCQHSAVAPRRQNLFQSTFLFARIHETP